MLLPMIATGAYGAKSAKHHTYEADANADSVRGS